MKVRFYSEQEEQEILRIVSDSNNCIRKAAKEFAKKYNRPIQGVIVKMYNKKRNLNSGAVVIKKKTTKSVKATPIVKEVAEVGVEVPHGMTFEGTPKKILLYSDHFRIFF
jgi:hypothetical protein